MRPAKITSWIVSLAWLALVLRASAQYPVASFSLLLVLPLALALVCYYNSVPSWLRWCAVVANGLYAALGLFLLIASLLGLMGVTYLAVGAPMLMMFLAIVVLIVPGGLNVRTLLRSTRRLPQSGV
ncbi:MAG: hypothetical protein RL030_2569 [Pseudomonadota bacterium]|jgi:fumarate reductase subunit C